MTLNSDKSAISNFLKFLLLIYVRQSYLNLRHTLHMMKYRDTQVRDINNIICETTQVKKRIFK